MNVRSLACAVAAAFLSGCVSLLQQRDYQKVAWADGDAARVEVWMRQGSTTVGQPLLFVLDVLGTPVICLAELGYAGFVAATDHCAIEGGPVGVLASLLPGITCVSLDAKPYAWLPLGTPLALPASARAELAGLTESGGVEWLARHYEANGPDGPRQAEKVREWVAAVKLAPPPSTDGLRQ